MARVSRFHDSSRLDKRQESKSYERNRTSLMSKYGETALLATDLVVSDKALDPEAAWKQAAQKLFPASKPLQDKGCPKGAFLGLCGAGLVQGVEEQPLGGSNKNGEYAVAAVAVLSKNPFLCSQPSLLWKKVAGPSKTENHQMDVVIGLWQAGRIRI